MGATLIQNALLLGLTVGLVARGRRAPPVLAGFGAAVALPVLGLVLAVLLALRPFGGSDLPGFEALGLFAWAPFVHLPLALFALAVLARRRAPRGAAAAGVAGALVVAVALWSFLVEPRWLEISHHQLASSTLERPLRIVLIADVQTDRVGDYERRTLRRAAELEGDLVLFAGDYVQVPGRKPEHRAREVERLREAVLAAGFAPRLGAFAVRGDIDPPGWERVFEGTPVQALRASEELDLGELLLTCLTPEDSRHGGPIPARAPYHVVLGHAPDFALAAVEADLLLAGHCHGGQVRLPFLGPLVTLSRIPREWTSGAHRIRPGSTLIVSRGVGLERAGAPPLRFLCRPELVVIDVLPARGEQRSRLAPGPGRATDETNDPDAPGLPTRGSG